MSPSRHSAAQSGVKDAHREGALQKAGALPGYVGVPRRHARLVRNGATPWRHGLDRLHPRADHEPERFVCARSKWIPSLMTPLEDPGAK